MDRLTLVLVLFLTALAAAQPRWQPDHTYVLVASITHWPATAGLAPFTGTRRDDDLVEGWIQTGVPRDHLTFLKDSQATHQGIRQALSSLADRTGPQDTLVFYFQGHGGRQKFYCYDYNPREEDKTVLAMSEIYALLRQWQGQRLFLIGDCCCSGSLDSVLQEFQRHRPDLPVAALASATATNLSTVHWTFTEGLIRILAGDPLVDADRNGQLDMAEAAHFLHHQMKYKEDQLASLNLSPHFPADFVLRATQGPPPRRLAGPYQIGDLLQARDKQGQWYPAEILGAKDALYQVHFNGWDSKWDEWLASDRLRAIGHAPLKVGQSCEVIWNGQWFPAVLTASVEDYFYFAHFLSEAGEDDEWITSERCRRPLQPLPRPEFQSAKPQANFEIGQMVAARWHKDWYLARITGQRNGTYAVHYEDNTDGHLIASELLPLTTGPHAAGQRMMAARGKQGQMFPGKIVQIEGDQARIQWEDGSPPLLVPTVWLAPILHRAGTGEDPRSLRDP